MLIDKVDYKKRSPMSSETKRKIGLANKGKYRAPLTDEQKEKLSIILKSKHRHCSEETKQKISLIHKGRKLTKEHKKKLSEAHKGKKVNITWGDKLSKALKGKKKSNEVKAKMSLAKLGTRQSEKTKEKRKQAAIKFYKNNPTSIEVKLYAELEKRNVNFVKQHLIYGFIVDAFVPSLNLVIEADGDYWHNRKDIKKRDKIKNGALTKYGYKMLRISETDINNNTFIDILNNTLNG